MLHSLVILFYFMIVFPLILQKTSSYHLHISHSKYSHHIYLLITHIFSYMAPEEIFSTWHIYSKIFVFLICISSPFYDYSCMFFDVYIHITFKLYFWLISTLVLHPLYLCVVLFFHKSYKEPRICLLLAHTHTHTPWERYRETMIIHI